MIWQLGMPRHWAGHRGLGDGFDNNSKDQDSADLSYSKAQEPRFAAAVL